MCYNSYRQTLIEGDKPMRHYAVIGDPIEQSRSPELYAALFERYGIDADFVKLRVTPDELGSFMRNDALSFDGLAVTMPHKRTVAAFLDTLDITAARCGAVNIIKNENGRLVGCNTDGGGLVAALRRLGFSPEGSSAAILGRGGAALAAAHALRDAGAEVTLLVRSLMPADAYSAPFRQVLFGEFAGPCDVFINATPLGMASYFDFEDFGFIQKLSLQVIYDMVYLSNRETTLVTKARQLGVTAESGASMLRSQALLAFKLWFGTDADRDLFTQ